MVRFHTFLSMSALCGLLPQVRKRRMQLGEELRHVFLRLALFTNDLIHQFKLCNTVLPQERVARAKDLFLEDGIELAELASPIVARQDSTAIVSCDDGPRLQSNVGWQ